MKDPMVTNVAANPRGFMSGLTSGASLRALRS